MIDNSEEIFSLFSSKILAFFVVVIFWHLLKKLLRLIYCSKSLKVLLFIYCYWWLSPSCMDNNGFTYHLWYYLTDLLNTQITYYGWKCRLFTFEDCAIAALGLYSLVILLSATDSESRLLTKIIIIFLKLHTVLKYSNL